jgi:hypothetical protein
MLRDILLSLAHIIFGFLASVSILIHPVLTIINFLIFLVYEMDQQWTISDHAYQELREYGLGFGLGVVFLFILMLSKTSIG